MTPLTETLTAAGHEDFQGHVLEQEAAAEDRPDLVEVPFAVEMVDVLQDLERHNIHGYVKILWPLDTARLIYHMLIHMHR